MRRDLLCPRRGNVIGPALRSARNSQTVAKQHRQLLHPAAAPASAAQADASSSPRSSIPARPQIHWWRRRARLANRRRPAETAEFSITTIFPAQGGVSAVGDQPRDASASDASGCNGSAPAPAELPRRRRERPGATIRELRKKMEQDQDRSGPDAARTRRAGRAVLQRSGESHAAELFRSDINKKTDKIDAKKKVIEADQQAISDAEEELRGPAEIPAGRARNFAHGTDPPCRRQS